MRELLGIFGNLYAGDFRRVQKAAVEIGITDKSDIKFFANRKGIYFRVDSVDKVDRGLSAQEPLPASGYNTIIYLFLLMKRYNYRYAVICQHLAMDFLIFPNLSTLVNVCQRIIFHGCV